MLQIFYFIAILNLAVNAIKHIIGVFQLTKLEVPIGLKILNTIEALSVAWLTFILINNYNLIFSLL